MSRVARCCVCVGCMCVVVALWLVMLCCVVNELCCVLLCCVWSHCGVL